MCMYFVQGKLLTCTALSVYKRCVCPCILSRLAASLYSTKCIQEVCVSMYFVQAGCLPVQH